MTEIDRLIIAAWTSVRTKLLADPNELAARLARRQKPLLTRPPRAWCLALRANDRRIDAPLARLASLPPNHPLTLSPPHAFTLSPPHLVTLSSSLLYKLIRPVETREEAHHLELARKLGVSYHGLRTARANRSIESNYLEGTGGHWGHPTPTTYAAPVNFPNAASSETPSPSCWPRD